MTLTEFLLARIAEDEAPTFRLVPYDCEPDCCAPAGYVGHECLICPDGPSFGGTVDAITEIAEEHAEQVHRHSRVLAECAAKRRIVEDLALPYIAERRRLMNGQPSWSDEHPDLLRLLTMPYADHPDYRAEWAV